MEKIRQKKVVEQVIWKISGPIADGEYKANCMLSTENGFAETFGIGQVSIGRFSIRDPIEVI